MSPFLSDPLVCLCPHLCCSHMNSLVLLSNLCIHPVPPYWALHLRYCVLISNQRRLLLSRCLMGCLLWFCKELWFSWAHSQPQAMKVTSRESGNWWKTEDSALLRMSEVGFCIMHWILEYQIDFFCKSGLARYLI